jgi:DsbC/DsbD-like thiol-disulfide interchange protein
LLRAGTIYVALRQTPGFLTTAAPKRFNGWDMRFFEMKRLPANTSLALMRAPKQGRLVVILAAAAALTTFIGSSPAPACSQDKPEDQVVSVRTLLSRDGVHPGDVFKAAFIVKIRPGYHVNDNAPLDQFLVPTSLSIDDCSSLEVLELAYPAGHRGRFAYSEAELVVYEGEVVFGALLKVKDGQAPGTVKVGASLSYQACDNMSCLPPKELPFEIDVPVVAPGRDCRDLNPEVFQKITFKALMR